MEKFANLKEAVYGGVYVADATIIGRHQDTVMNEYATSVRFEWSGDFRNANRLVLHDARYYLAAQYDEQYGMLMVFDDSEHSERMVNVRVHPAESQSVKLGIATAQIGSILVGGKVFTRDPKEIDQVQLSIYDDIAKDAHSNKEQRSRDYLSPPRKLNAVQKLAWLVRMVL